MELQSQSQIGQETYVLEKLQYKTGGYFLEIGGGDGYTLSNTFLLERKFNWTGILVEPSNKFHDISKHRNCITVQACVSDKAGKDIFVEGMSDSWYNGRHHSYLSALKGTFNETLFINNQPVRIPAIQGIEREVNTVLLETILDEAKAPSIIDYFSLDVEGSEYAILKNFPFDKYKFRVMTIEHNGLQPHRGNIRTLLESHGYKYDKTLEIDDCYVLDV